MSITKPKGMRIGESVFCVGYLLFALGAGVSFFHARNGATGAFAMTCAAMTLLLGGGDAFHLIPRIMQNLQDEPRGTEDQRLHHVWIGLGNLVSSVTMTVFYVYLFDAMRQMPGVSAEAHAPQVLRLVLIALAAVRIGLCLFPQNRWFDGEGSQVWGIRRNLPFVAMGGITVFYLLVWYQAWLLALLVVASFGCYMCVVLYARERPMMGMLMIPKTMCYIGVIALFLGKL